LSEVVEEKTITLGNDERVRENDMKANLLQQSNTTPEPQCTKTTQPKTIAMQQKQNNNTQQHTTGCFMLTKHLLRRRRLG
jgi:hypothetical protein